MGAFRDKQSRPSANGAGGKDPQDRAWAQLRPALHEFISEVTNSSGGPMQGATLMLFAEDSVFKVMLHDRLGSCSLWASADTIEGAYDALEAKLVAGSADWRADRQPGRGRKS